MRTNSLLSWVSVLALATSAAQAWAATPPELVNFEGVLRDSMGNPESGAKDMTFHFYDTDGGGGCPAAGGTLLLTDEHLNAGTGDVTVADGLFNVQLGSGNVVTGSAASLGEVFQDNAAVYMEVEIDAELLCPRIRVTSAGYSLNAATLDGVDASGYLDTSVFDQVKGGNLQVADLTVAGWNVFGAPGSWLELAPDFNAIVNDADTDALYLYAGNSLDDGSIIITGDGSFDIYSGDGTFRFRNGAAGNVVTSDLDGSGNLQTVGAITAQTLQSRGDLFANTDGPDGDSFLYFYDGTPTQRYLKWNDLLGRFETSSRLYAPTLEAPTIDGTDVRVYGDLYFNWNGPNGDGNLYFHRDASNTAEWIRWNDLADIFETSRSMLVHGTLQADDQVYVGSSLYVNSDGPEGDGNIYFYDGGSASGERIRWYNFGDYFDVSNSMLVNGALQATTSLFTNGDLTIDGQQIAINNNGPNGNQDIEFYNGAPQFERFQWDATALRFEVSDDFHAFGEVSGTVKNFVQNHPHRDDLEIVYSSLEGNEVTTFTRGSARLAGGKAHIELEESFRYVTNPEIGLSAHLTPRGPSSTLYVESVSAGDLVVRSVDGDDVAFDFVVYGLRIGYEDFPVYRPKRAESFVPPPGWFAGEFADEPALAEHTALSRYRRMAAAAFDRSVEQMPAAAALREAIGMREPDLDFPRGSEVSVREMNRLALAAEADSAEAEIPRPPAAHPPARDVVPRVAPAPDERRDIYARSFRPSAGDIARLVPVHEPVEAGDVLVIDAASPGSAMLARFEADTAVFGVVASEPGVVLGSSDTVAVEGGATEAPIAVSGVVLCKVDASWGAIRPGDLLQTSPTPGHAMRADDPTIGGVLGKALDPLDVGTGLIRVLVTLR